MAFAFDAKHGHSQVFWLHGKTLPERLSLLLPGVSMVDVDIVSTDLSGNASFVNYVRHHELTHKVTGDVIEVVEKSIRKVFGISSLEARFYRERDVLSSSVHFKHPPCYGLIETPWESLVFTHYVRGKAPRMHAIAGDVARGIAEIESLSHAYLTSAGAGKAWKFWQMDFFRPWFLLRPRFNFSWFFKHLRQLAVEDERFEGIEAQLRFLRPQLRSMARIAKSSPKCFCHMDYLRKNLFISAQGLQLIDWSEVKVGRAGFDGGAYLSALFRRNDMERYLQVRDVFLGAYERALSPCFDVERVMHNVSYVFLLNSLWHCMRPETIGEYRRNGRMPLLRQKFDYLLTLRSDP